MDRGRGGWRERRREVREGGGEGSREGWMEEGRREMGSNGGVTPECDLPVHRMAVPSPP